MKRNVLLCLVAIVTLQTNCLQAQQSPYSLKWKREGLILGAGIATAIVGSALDDNIAPLTLDDVKALDRNTVNGFDRRATRNYSERAANVSNLALAGSLSLPALLLAGKAPRNDFAVIGVMYMESLLFSTFLPSIGKGAVERTRPFAYNPDAPLDKKLTAEARRSFFSGHTTFAFSSAVFVATVYSAYYPDSKWKPVVWGGSLALAGVVGYTRVSSGAHFPTDVLVGAAVGSAVGYLVPRLHRTDNKASLTVVPVYAKGTQGLTASVVF